MRRARAWCVRGEVRDASGLLRGDVARSLRPDAPPAAGVLNEGGRFLLTGLTPGVYTLVASDYPQLGRVLAERVIRVERNMEGVAITVPPRPPGRRAAPLP